MKRKPKERQIFLNGEPTNYTVSNYGDVYTIDKCTGEKKNRKLRKDKDGYYTVGLYHNKKYRECRVSRLVANAFVKVPLHLRFLYDTESLQVNHKNGVHDDNYYKNLEWTTAKGNIKHAWKHGLVTAKYGDNSPNSKYTNDQIHEVCQLLEYGKVSYKEISEMTDVSYTVVKQIKNRIIWTSISDQYDINKEHRKKRGAPLTKKKIKRICKYIRKSKSDKWISEKMSVSTSSVSNIRRRKTHTDITQYIDF